MKRLLILASLLLSTADAQVPANQARLTWAAPTQDANGLPLPAGSIQRYYVQWTFNGGEWQQLPELAPTTGFVHGNLAPGRYCYRIIVTARDVPSLPSNEMCKVITPSAPKAVVLTVE